MKLIPITFLSLGLVGCSTNQPPQTVHIHHLPPNPLPERETVQRSAFLKAYPVGRYVDPADPSVLHEGHVIYVEEAPPAWNLAPQRPVFVPLGPEAGPTDSARAPVPSGEELRREFDAQRKAVRALTNQAARVLEAQTQLNAVVPLVKQSVEQGAALQQQQRVMEERMRLLETELRPPARSTGTNVPPANKPSTNW